MYTTVPRPEVIDHRPKSGEPLPVIIDHRGNGNTSRWRDRHRKEQLPYETLKKHRDALLEAEFKYKKTIKELEKEREELVVTYESAYQENKQLKSILEHGPDAAKLKQLVKDKKEQKGVIEQLQEENKELGDRLKRLEKFERLTNPANDILERNWKETLDKVRKKREEEDAIPTQGPFAGGKLFKKKRIAIDDTRLEELDTYDLQLDTIQKETQVLLNKVKQLKREKDQIDYTLMMGKGAVSRNAVVANAISEKLNRDLNKYAIRLEKLKIKHKSAKRYVDEVRSVYGETVSNDVSLPSLDAKEQELESPTPKKNLSYKAKPSNKLQKGDLKENGSPHNEGNKEMPISIEEKTPWSFSTKIPDSFDKKTHEKKPRTYSKIHQKSVQYSEPKVPEQKVPEQKVPENNAKPNTAETSDSPENEHTLNNNFRDDMSIQKTKHRIKTLSQGSLIRTTRAQSMRDTWVKKKDASKDSGGRYANEIEPIHRRKKTKVANYSPRSEEKNKSAVSARSHKTFPYYQPVQMNNKYEIDNNETYDDVLEYLKNQNRQQESVRDQFDKQRDRRYSSPVPIKFSDDGRNVHGKENLYSMGNTGIRDINYFPVKYVM